MLDMDLENECSALESVEDNEAVGTKGTVSHFDDDSVKNNGSFLNEINKLDGSVSHDANNIEPVGSHGKGVDSVQLSNSPSLAMKSPAGVSPPMTKGYGLKKWRRIRRDFVKDAGTSVDSSKAVKRGISGAVNPTKPVDMSSVEARQNCEGSVGSANVMKNVGSLDGFATHGSSLDSRFAVGSAFMAGTDSENSEDRSSKSSTAASARKTRYELPAILGYAREKKFMKNLSTKSGSNSTQGAQLGKSRAECSKKPRGERIKIEKENSHSSMESDSRTSNFVFMQGTFSVTSNGKQSGRSMSYDGENSDDAHACEQGEEVQTGFTKENAGEAEDLSQDDLADLSWDAKGEKSENHSLSTDRDPLIESILTLQSVQEALEREVQKFGEIGKDATSLHNNSFKGISEPVDSTCTDAQNQGPNSSSQLGSEKIRESATCSLEMQVLSLTQNVEYLERKLEEAKAMLQVKDARVVELETTLNSSKPLKEELGSTIDLQPEKCIEMEAELEGLFQQKIEAEIEHLVLTRTMEKVKGAAGDPITLFKEQETLVEERTRMLNKLIEAESKAVVVKKQAQKLEKHCGDILGTDALLKMQKGIFKITSCFLIQFILLVLVFCLFLSQLSPYSGVAIPT
ncbi:WPP domain-interacting protein 2-like [Mangifera indica]|uniref:WPP domain-interacting protein 2-like n=1 Tax=Mangifera indica TaxID=29780 RepID=UPI001CFB980B|nr:WPP domain-interacting protein 2-like [Mangifera indica]XP_044473676.1 WPP domain-interacting protein 2-like [Mangifera indica]XP_044473677.1 WPP domain-interacting protein 2-like [Mangifera indica]XP_044473678.1 WPP domain-interacting protein 2-like [Mangifera indica]